MATIRASCPEHGDCELTNNKIDVIGFGKLDSYRFRCPIGNEVVIKQTFPRTIELLIASNCKEYIIGLPKIEYLDIEQFPPLTEDNLSDYCLKQEEDNEEKNLLYKAITGFDQTLDIPNENTIINTEKIEQPEDNDDSNHTNMETEVTEFKKNEQPTQAEKESFYRKTKKSANNLGSTVLRKFGII